MRRALLLALVLLAAASAQARADDAPVADHVDTFRQLDGIDLPSEVGRARLNDFAPGIAAAGLPTSWCGTETATDDTADFAYPKAQPQFKVIYAYPSDRPDRFAQFKDALQADASLIDQFVSSQPGSTRAPRFDLGTACGPQYLDIQTVALPSPRATYVENLNALESYVRTKVNPSPGGKRDYVIVADTLAASQAAGIGELYEGSRDSERPDLSNVHNGGGLTAVLWYPDDVAPGADPNGWWPEGMLHEMTHTMGGVQWSAPHSSQPVGGRSYAYSHCWDGRDVMCHQDGPAMAHAYDPTICPASAGTMPDAYDCGQDDYFNPDPPTGSYLETHWNVYDSVFMADCSTMPAGACLASGPTDPPANTAVPAVTGIPADGELLTGAKGTWSPSGISYAYQWLRDGAPITGATASTYRVTSADDGAMIALQVTAISPYGSVPALSDPVGPVAPRPPAIASPPVITGAAIAGATVSATTGSWSPPGTSYVFQWQRDSGSGFADVPRATTAAYRIPATDAGALLRVNVTARNADGVVTASSASIGPVVNPTPVNTVAPRILGAAKSGTLLTATTGTWNPGAAGYAIQWERDLGFGFSDIAGARTSTYRLAPADKNASIRVRVTAISGSISTVAHSAVLGPVLAQPPLNTALPKIAGTALVGATLTGTSGTWSPAGTSYAYQWRRDNGSGFADVPGAIRTAYKLTGADVDAHLQLRVLAVNADGALTATSLSFGPVKATAASATLKAGASAPVRSATGAALASASVSGGAARAAAVNATLTVSVRRAHAARGRLKVLACAATCTPARTLGARAVRLKVGAASTVRVLLAR